MEMKSQAIIESAALILASIFQMHLLSMEPAVAKPAWASEIKYDKFGPRAFLKIGKYEIGLRYILPGTFIMGSDISDKNRDDFEAQRVVTLSKPFWITESEVTQGIWLEKMIGNPSRKTDHLRLPVNQVEYEQCLEFLDKLEVGALLPTEAEWEYCARAGTRSDYNDGSDCETPKGKILSLDRLCWYYDEFVDAQRMPQLVMQKRPNSWGLYDMHGNVFEMCRDWLAPYDKNSTIDPIGPKSGEWHVIRGGCSFSHAYECRSSYRRKPEYMFNIGPIGFRFIIYETDNVKKNTPQSLDQPRNLNPSPPPTP